MFRRLLRHLQGEFLSYAQNYVAVFDYRSEDILYMGSQYYNIYIYIILCYLFLFGNKLYDFFITVIAKDVCIDCL
jgi:hypothetical protein